LAEHLQGAGYRAAVVEQDGLPYLTSASQGIGFVARFGNRAGDDGTFLDFSFSAVLQVQGEPPVALAEGWNRSRRFARLSVQGALIVLDMDVTVAGGVSAPYLRAQIELWDRLVQELLLYVRQAAVAAPAPVVLAAPVATAA
jgi:hypothetical protein